MTSLPESAALPVVSLLLTLGIGCGGPTEEPDPLLCPPPAPHGTEPGDYAAELELYDLDRNPIAIQGYCGNKVVLLYHFYGW